jgi:hypothetical protein
MSGCRLQQLGAKSQLVMESSDSEADEFCISTRRLLIQGCPMMFLQLEFSALLGIGFARLLRVQTEKAVAARKP